MKEAKVSDIGSYFNLPLSKEVFHSNILLSFLPPLLLCSLFLYFFAFLVNIFLGSTSTRIVHVPAISPQTISWKDNISMLKSTGRVRTHPCSYSSTFPPFCLLVSPLLSLLFLFLTSNRYLMKPALYFFQRASPLSVHSSWTLRRNQVCSFFFLFILDVFLFLFLSFCSPLFTFIFFVGSPPTAAHLVGTLVETFPAFADKTEYQGKQIFILKKAQLLAADLYRRFKVHTFTLSFDLPRLLSRFYFYYPCHSSFFYRNHYRNSLTSRMWTSSLCSLITSYQLSYDR